MTTKSGMPALSGFDPPLVNWLEKLGKDRSDLRAEFDAFADDVNSVPADLSGSGDAITTVADATAATLTNAFGTANTTLADTSGTSADIANNFADCTAQINKLITDDAALRTSLSALVTATQTRLDAIEDKLNALLAVLRTAGE